MHSTMSTFTYTINDDEGEIAEEHRVTIHFDGDYRGMTKIEIPIELAQPDEFDAPGIANVMTSFISVDIPFEILQSLVAEKIRQDRIAALEEMSDQEVLSGHS
jgi:hypothetical protein